LDTGFSNQLPVSHVLSTKLISTSISRGDQSAGQTGPGPDPDQESPCWHESRLSLTLWLFLEPRTRSSLWYKVSARSQYPTGAPTWRSYTDTELYIGWVVSWYTYLPLNGFTPYTKLVFIIGYRHKTIGRVAFWLAIKHHTPCFLIVLHKQPSPHPQGVETSWLLEPLIILSALYSPVSSCTPYTRYRSRQADWSKIGYNYTTLV